MSIEPTQPDTTTPDPGVTPEIPPVKLPPRRDPDDGKAILNPDGTLHLGADGSAMLHSRTADPCCPTNVCCIPGLPPPEGPCVEGLTETECFARGGTYWPDRSCDTFDCPGNLTRCDFACRPDSAPYAWEAIVSGLTQCYETKCCGANHEFTLTMTPPAGRFVVPHVPNDSVCAYCVIVGGGTVRHRTTFGSDCEGDERDLICEEGGSILLTITHGAQKPLFCTMYMLQSVVGTCFGDAVCGTRLFLGWIEGPEWLGCNHEYTVTDSFTGGCPGRFHPSCGVIIAAGGVVSLRPLY